MTERGPMLVAARPIITSDEEGPARGTLIMGRLLTASVIETLVEQTRVTFNAWPIPGDSMPAEERSIAPQITAADSVLITEPAEGPLRVYATMADITGAPILLIRTDVPRDITARGVTAVQFALLSIVAAGLLILLILWSTLQRVVVGPISRLTAHTIGIGTSGDLTKRLAMQRRDEIGRLAQEFDRTVSQLAQARKQLAEQSYRSGVAEMVAGVMHNVGNALSPVIVGLDGVRQELGKTPLDQIETAERMLAESSPSDERREDLTQFLNLAHHGLVTGVRKASAGLADIVSRVGQIEQILADHRHLGLAEQPVEVVSVGEVLEDAQRLVPQDVRQAIALEVEPTVVEQGKGRAHRIALLQVFANILTNAGEAIQRAGMTRGAVHVSAEIDDTNGSRMLDVKLRDTGVGIAPDILGRIFERGFTTKEDGTAGVGLHWSATAVSAMGGRIFAESDGVGRGACLHVLIPKSP